MVSSTSVIHFPWEYKRNHLTVQQDLVASVFRQHPPQSKGLLPFQNSPSFNFSSFPT